MYSTAALSLLAAHLVMATDLVIAALAGDAISDTDGDDDSHRDCDEMPGCVAAVSHKVAAVSHVMHAECGAAVSHKECDLVAKTVSVGNKKEQSEVESAQVCVFFLPLRRPPTPTFVYVRICIRMCICTYVCTLPHPPAPTPTHTHPHPPAPAPQH